MSNTERHHVRLLKRRGRAMQRAVPVGAGAMAALIGFDLDAARELATEAAATQICAVANDNGGGQVVVSGDKAAVDAAFSRAKHIVKERFHINRIAAKLRGLTPDEGAIARGEQALPPVIGSLEGHNIRCPWHKCLFDARSGREVGGDGCLTTYPVAVSDGIIGVAANVPGMPQPVGAAAPGT